MPKCKIIRYYFSPKKMDATDVGKKMEKSEYSYTVLGNVFGFVLKEGLSLCSPGWPQM
jgi:hypothetical protein